jgi:hypothetical protein
MNAAEHADAAAKLLSNLALDPQQSERHFLVQMAVAHALTALALDVTEPAPHRRLVDAVEAERYGSGDK